MLESIQNEELEYQKISPEEQQRRGILGRLVGICADFIDPTRNGRHYSEQLWERTFNDPIMKERIENGVCFGELCHPADREETDMEKIAVCLPEVPKKGKDGKLRAVFDILDTPNGRILKTLCDYGSKLGVSSRGSGDTYTDMDGNEEVDPDSYTCQGFDIVLIPAVKAARLQYVTESLDSKKSLKESLQDIVNSASDADRKVMEETLDKLHLNESAGSDLKAVVLETIDYIKDIFPFEPKNWYGFSNWEEVAENLDYNIGDLEETAEGLIAELDATIKATEKIYQGSTDPDADITDDPEYTIEKELLADLQRALDKATKEPQLDEEKEILYVIKDKHGNQLSRPIADDSELWDRVESRDPDGKRGLRVVVYTGANEELEDSTASFDIEDDLEKEAVGDDEALLEELQKALRRNQDLEQEIITLNEKLSVCYAKEDKARVKNDVLKNSIKKLTQRSSQAAALQRKVDTLQESLSKSESNCEKLKERLEKAKTSKNSLTEQLKKDSNEKAALTKKLFESNSTIQKLEEQVAELTKDLHQTKQNYSAKLNKSNRLVEKYRATTQGVVDKYISSQALKLGVKPEEVRNRLPESYSMSDIDEVCEELQSYKLNLSKLPFTTMPGLSEGLQMKANPSKQKDLASVNTDDLVDEQLMSLMGLK